MFRNLFQTVFRAILVHGFGLFRVWGLGFRVCGVGFRVWGVGFGLEGFGFRVFRVWDGGFGVRGLGFEACSSGVSRVYRVSRSSSREAGHLRRG